MILVLISILTIIVVGAICFWAIDRFATDRRLANLLKLLVILICLGAILQRVLPMTNLLERALIAPPPVNNCSKAIMWGFLIGPLSGDDPLPLFRSGDNAATTEKARENEKAFCLAPAVGRLKGQWTDD
jgi:hypothetical protein